MAKHLTLALLLVLAGSARADGAEKRASATPEAKAEKPAAAKPRGEKAKPDPDGAATARPAKAPEAAPEKPTDGKTDKPCEPVKPCPID
jgi:hypothetical protein